MPDRAALERERHRMGGRVVADPLQRDRLVVRRAELLVLAGREQLEIARGPGRGRVDAPLKVTSRPGTFFLLTLVLTTWTTPELDEPGWPEGRSACRDGRRWRNRARLQASRRARMASVPATSVRPDKESVGGIARPVGVSPLTKPIVGRGQRWKRRARGHGESLAAIASGARGDLELAGDIIDCVVAGGQPAWRDGVGADVARLARRVAVGESTSRESPGLSPATKPEKLAANVGFG